MHLEQFLEAAVSAQVDGGRHGPATPGAEDGGPQPVGARAPTSRANRCPEFLPLPHVSSSVCRLQVPRLGWEGNSKMPPRCSLPCDSTEGEKPQFTNSVSHSGGGGALAAQGTSWKMDLLEDSGKHLCSGHFHGKETQIVGGKT